MIAHKYTIEVILSAKQVFIEGGTLGAAARKVKELTGRNCRASTVLTWSKEKDADNGFTWLEERETLRKALSKELMSSTSRGMIERAKEHIDAYQKMQETGLKALKDKSVTVDRMSEAVELIDKGIRGERQVSSGLVSYKYIELVVSIIAEEVTDEETKRRIASRLQKATVDVLSI